MSIHNASKLKNIAQQYVERSKAMGDKGKRRDDLAVEFFLGVYACALVGDDPTWSDYLGFIVSCAICPRGFSEVERLSKMTIIHDSAAT